MRAAEFLDGLGKIERVLNGQNVYVVTDTRVAALYPSLFEGKRHTAIPAGEANKNLDTVGAILADMVRAGCDRKTTVVAVGGGVVGDTAGFAAACFMRGVRWINVPTTLLAMVDSGIGGKTGVDVRGYKNIAGAFHLPKRVLICPRFLQTLPEREWLCGCGEMVKHALLSAEIYEATLRQADGLFRRDPQATADLVERSARYKESVVRKDFREKKGLRKRLNVGHTVGHAVEKADGFRRSHGEYVAFGIRAEMTMLKERVDETFYREAMRLTYAVCPDGIPVPSAEEIADIARADKKNAGGKISVMLPLGGGETEEVWLTPEEFAERLEHCLSNL